MLRPYSHEPLHGPIKTHQYRAPAAALGSTLPTIHEGFDGPDPAVGDLDAEIMAETAEGRAVDPTLDRLDPADNDRSDTETEIYISEGEPTDTEFPANQRDETHSTTMGVEKSKKAAEEQVNLADEALKKAAAEKAQQAEEARRKADAERMAVLNQINARISELELAAEGAKHAQRGKAPSTTTDVTNTRTKASASLLGTAPRPLVSPQDCQHTAANPAAGGSQAGPSGISKDPKGKQTMKPQQVQIRGGRRVASKPNKPKPAVGPKPTKIPAVPAKPTGTITEATTNAFIKHMENRPSDPEGFQKGPGMEIFTEYAKFVSTLPPELKEEAHAALQRFVNGDGSEASVEVLESTLKAMGFPVDQYNEKLISTGQLTDKQLLEHDVSGIIKPYLQRVPVMFKAISEFRADPSRRQGGSNILGSSSEFEEQLAENFARKLASCTPEELQAILGQVDPMSASLFPVEDIGRPCPDEHCDVCSAVKDGRTGSVNVTLPTVPQENAQLESLPITPAQAAAFNALKKAVDEIDPAELPDGKLFLKKSGKGITESIPVQYEALKNMLASETFQRSIRIQHEDDDENAMKVTVHFHDPAQEKQPDEDEVSERQDLESELHDIVTRNLRIRKTLKSTAAGMYQKLASLPEADVHPKLTKCIEDVNAARETVKGTLKSIKEQLAKISPDNPNRLASPADADSDVPVFVNASIKTTGPKNPTPKIEEYIVRVHANPATLLKEDPDDEYSEENLQKRCDRAWDWVQGELAKLRDAPERAFEPPPPKVETGVDCPEISGEMLDNWVAEQRKLVEAVPVREAVTAKDASDGWYLGGYEGSFWVADKGGGIMKPRKWTKKKKRYGGDHDENM